MTTTCDCHFNSASYCSARMTTGLQLGQHISNGNSTVFAHGFSWGENLTVKARTELGYIVADRHGRHGYAY